VVYGKTMNKLRKLKGRAYISLYFQNGNAGSRKKRDFTLSFKEDDPIYLKCKDISSTRIKEIIGISSYGELKQIAKRESRSLGNYVKSQLIKYFKTDE
jgi:hypothetical protein